MAKKKVEKEKDWTLEVEQAARKAISNIKGGFEDLSELEWTKHVAEGLAVYLEGIEARLQELEEPETDDGDE